MGYTKGKWETNGNYISNGNILISRVIPTNKDEKENDANARLISKAPEMHEALRDVRTDITIVGKVSHATLEKIKLILKELKS